MQNYPYAIEANQAMHLQHCQHLAISHMNRKS